MIQISLYTQVIFGSGKAKAIFANLESQTVVFYSPSALNCIDVTAEQKTLSHWFAVVGEPSVESVNLFLSQLTGSVRQVVGIGGGSAMDTAKAVAICIEKGLNRCDSLLDQQISEARERVKLLLCPSTSGTGSELSMGAIIYDAKQKIKRGIRGRGVLADRAVVDPMLTLSCSNEVTAQSGFDCLAHAVETFVSKKSTEYTKTLSLFAMRLVFKHLPEAIRNGELLDAREKLALASTTAGYNLSCASTCLPHRIQYAFEEKWQISHGLGLAMIYPSWIENTRDLHGEFRAIESALGIRSLLDEVQALKEKVGINAIIQKKTRDFRIDLNSDLIRGNLADDPGYTPETLNKIVLSLKGGV